MSRQILTAIFFIVFLAGIAAQESIELPQVTIDNIKEQYHDTPWENTFSLGFSYLKTLDLGYLLNQETALSDTVDALGIQYGWFSGRRLGFYFEGSFGFVLAPIKNVDTGTLNVGAITNAPISADITDNLLGTATTVFFGLGGQPYVGKVLRLFMAGGALFTAVHYMPVLLNPAENRNQLSFGVGPAVSIRIQFKLNQIILLDFGAMTGYSYEPIIWSESVFGSTHTLVIIPSASAVFSWKDNSRQVQLYSW